MATTNFLIRLFVGAVIITATLGSSFAEAEGPQCSFLFLPFLQLNEASTKPTVQIAGSVFNARGEEFLKIQKLSPELPWLSTHAPRRYDTQYDPTWPIHFLGPDLATIAGYAFSSNGALLTPTPETQNARWAAFNAFLVSKKIEPIPVSFYRQTIATMISFLTGWKEGPAIPVADGMDGHTVHDVGAHGAGVSIAPPVLRLIQATAGLALEWLRFTNPKTIPPVVRNTVADIDMISAAANIRFNYPQSFHAINLSRIVFERLTHPVMPMNAVKTSPLQIFEKRLLTYTPKTEKLTVDMFARKMRRDHPEWDLPISAFGIKKPGGIYELQYERSNVLRRAGHEFLQTPMGQSMSVTP